nr:uncharacterized protein LOC114604465 isoform X2 [Podarcis muralis]
MSYILGGGCASWRKNLPPTPRAKGQAASGTRHNAAPSSLLFQAAEPFHHEEGEPPGTRGVPRHCLPTHKQARQAKTCRQEPKRKESRSAGRPLLSVRSEGWEDRQSWDQAGASCKVLAARRRFGKKQQQQQQEHKREREGGRTEPMQVRRPEAHAIAAAAVAVEEEGIPARDGKGPSKPGQERFSQSEVTSATPSGGQGQPTSAEKPKA